MRVGDQHGGLLRSVLQGEAETRRLGRGAEAVGRCDEEEGRSRRKSRRTLNRFSFGFGRFRPVSVGFGRCHEIRLDQKLEAVLAKKMAEFDQATEEKLRCEREFAGTRMKMDLANRLVNGLSAENDRWAKSVTQSVCSTL